jgi:hypothetical protein
MFIHHRCISVYTHIFCEQDYVAKSATDYDLSFLNAETSEESSSEELFEEETILKTTSNLKNISQTKTVIVLSYFSFAHN